MSDMMSLTCRNHPKARYLTKRIPGRSLHFIEADPDYVRSVRPNLVDCTDDQLRLVPIECPCPSSDLIEIEEGE